MAGKRYCVDSDVVIWHLRNATRRTTVTSSLEALARAGTLTCSAITVAEVEQGIRTGEEASTRGVLGAFDVYAADRVVAQRAGEMVRDLRARGRTMGLADAIIAATCVVHGLELVTLNLKDFAQITGLNVQVLT